MDVVNVQFDNEERKVIIAEFSAVQDTRFWTNQGGVSIDDERYKVFKERAAINAGPDPATSTPALKRNAVHLSGAALRSTGNRVFEIFTVLGLEGLGR